MEPPPAIARDKAVFVADAHLRRDDEDARAFLDLAGRAAREEAALFLLGDIFDLWFGTEGLTFPFQRPVIARLRDLRREGLRLFYVEGNRDFYLKRLHEGTTFDVVAEGDLQATVGARRIECSHGDTVNRADRAYRFWKAVSKNRLAFGTVSLLPSSLVLPLADRMERSLKPTNPRFKGRFPEAEIRAFARARFAEGADAVVLGHFHTERLVEFPGEGAPRVLAVLPAWREGRRHFYVAPGGRCGFRALLPGEPLVP